MVASQYSAPAKTVFIPRFRFADKDIHQCVSIDPLARHPTCRLGLRGMYVGLIRIANAPPRPFKQAIVAFCSGLTSCPAALATSMLRHPTLSPRRSI